MTDANLASRIDLAAIVTLTRRDVAQWFIVEGDDVFEADRVTEIVGEDADLRPLLRAAVLALCSATWDRPTLLLDLLELQEDFAEAIGDRP